MANVWTFDPPDDELSVHADGTELPSRRQVVRLNGEAVGEIEIHLHRRAGPDRALDLSYGVTAIAYGPLAPRAKADAW